MAKDQTTISIEIADLPFISRLLPALAAWTRKAAERETLSPEEEALMGATLALAEQDPETPIEAAPGRIHYETLCGALAMLDAAEEALFEAGICTAERCQISEIGEVLARQRREILGGGLGRPNLVADLPPAAPTEEG